MAYDVVRSFALASYAPAAQLRWPALSLEPVGPPGPAQKQTTPMREVTGLLYRMCPTSVRPSMVRALVKRLDAERRAFQRRRFSQDRRTARRA